MFEKVDPRTKVVLILCSTMLALVYNKPLQLLFLLGAVSIILLVFGVNPALAGGCLKKFFPLFLLLLVVQCVFNHQGQTLLAAGSISLVTTRGLELGLSAGLRMLVVVVAAIVLLTTNSRDLMLGLVQWKVPYEIAFMFAIALRFLPVFREEITNAVTAVQLRGVEFKQVAWGQKIALYRCLFLPVVFATMLKARQLSMAMEGRAFRAYPQRTYLRKLNLGLLDYGLMIFSLIVTLGLMTVQLF